MASVSSFIGWFVSWVTQTLQKKISTKLGWKMGHRPEWTTLTFGVAPGKGMDQDYFLTFSNIVREGVFPLFS